MKPNLNLPYFFLASLCLHGGLVFPLLSAFQFAGQKETVLSVTLDAAKEPTASTTSNLAVARVHRTMDDTRHTLSTDSATAWQSETTALPTASRESADLVDSNDSRNESARAQIEAQLQIDLQRYFEYPMIARRMGWQGTVWLSYTIQADGTLDRIEVNRSSGHDMLDSAAVSTMRRIERLAEAKQWLGGRSLSLNTAILYRLKDR